VVILLLGNIAMAVYCLIQLFRVPATADLREVLLRKVDSESKDRTRKVLAALQ